MGVMSGVPYAPCYPPRLRIAMLSGKIYPERKTARRFAGGLLQKGTRPIFLRKNSSPAQTLIGHMPIGAPLPNLEPFPTPPLFTHDPTRLYPRPAATGDSNPERIARQNTRAQYRPLAPVTPESATAPVPPTPT